MNKKELHEKIETLQNMLIDYATGGGADQDKYKTLRGELLQEASIRPLLPHFIITFRDLPQFWGFIKGKFVHYQERREYLWSEFAPLIEKLEIETLEASPVDHLVTGTLDKLDATHIQDAWSHALERKIDDPEGAITAARTLLESVCKSLLDEMQIEYPENSDLPQLYKLVAEQINLAPSQHSERIFKQILGGCQTVVEGLGTIRNRLGDAHGQGRQAIRPAPRHAELAVNLAGAMSIFLVHTWEFNKHKNAG